MWHRRAQSLDVGVRGGENTLHAAQIALQRNDEGEEHHAFRDPEVRRTDLNLKMDRVADRSPR